MLSVSRGCVQGDMYDIQCLKQSVKVECHPCAPCVVHISVGWGRGEGQFGGSLVCSLLTCCVTDAIVRQPDKFTQIVGSWPSFQYVRQQVWTLSSCNCVYRSSHCYDLLSQLLASHTLCKKLLNLTTTMHGSYTINTCFHRFPALSKPSLYSIHLHV